MSISENAKKMTTIFNNGWSDAIKPPEFKSDKKDRPNILMIFSDQHNHAMSGYAGHKIVQTPGIDKLAAQGVVFEQAHCNSRFALLPGNRYVGTSPAQNRGME